MGQIAAVANKGIAIIIQGLLLFGITEITFLIGARILVVKNGWNVKRAMALAQLLWLPVAYFIAIHLLTSLANIRGNH